MKLLELNSNKKYSTEEIQCMLNAWRACGIIVYNEYGWVNVKDKLPQDGEYLVSDGKIVVSASYTKEYDHWDLPQIFSAYDPMLLMIVEYWCELPSPPREK